MSSNMLSEEKLGDYGLFGQMTLSYELVDMPKKRVAYKCVIRLLGDDLSWFENLLHR